MVEKNKTKIPKLERKRIAQIPLSQSVKSIILGSILGSGSLKIDNGCRNAVFCFNDSFVRSDYFHWKVQTLKEISSFNSVYLQKADNCSQNHKLIFKSKPLEQLTKICNVIKVKKQLFICRSWLNHLTPLSLAVWWCDNGTLASSGGALCIYGFPREQVIILTRYLEIVWKINVRCCEVRAKKNHNKSFYYKLWLNKTEIKKFLIIILPHIPVKAMIYKTLLIYKDPDFQQRWISKVKSLISSNLVSFVDEEFMKKKMKVNLKLKNLEKDIVH